MTRDLTKKQFAKKLAKYNMIPQFGGYVDIGKSSGLCVYRWNGGDKLRSQLAYLIAEQRKHCT